MNGPDLYSFRALRRHYRQCRRNKRNTANALAFEVNAEAKLLELQQELRAHTYEPGRSICFITDGPKPRETVGKIIHPGQVGRGRRRISDHDAIGVELVP